MAKTILILPGDGIGPEIVAEAVKILEVLQRRHGLDVEWQEGLIGGAAYDSTGSPLPEETLTVARQAKLKLSSQLLKLATIVDQSGGGN